ncbi:unnamed protein product, partial [Discosporangium mesarthrocarpum]
MLAVVFAVVVSAEGVSLPLGRVGVALQGFNVGRPPSMTKDPVVTTSRALLVAHSVRGGMEFSNGEDNCAERREGSEDEDEVEDGGEVDKAEATLGPAHGDGLVSVVRGLLSRFLEVLEGLLEKSGFGRGRSSEVLGGSFTEHFERKYGKSHPEFSGMSIVSAMDRAWSLNRLCLVYIASDAGGGRKAKVDDTICQTLTDPVVRAFIDKKFVLWAAKAGSPGAAVAGRRVGARAYPYLGVIHTSSRLDRATQRRRTSRSTTALHHCNPPPSPSQMLSWMSRVLDLNKGRLKAERAEQRHQEEEEAIHRERTEGYVRAVTDDALLEEREAQEARQRELEEEEERQRERARAEKEKEDSKRRDHKAKELGPEPLAAAAEGVSTVMLRLQDGSRVKRRFLRSDNMGRVLDWADVQGVDLSAQQLSMSFPKTTFTYPRDANLSLEEAGLGKQAMLFVEANKSSRNPKGGTGAGEAGGGTLSNKQEETQGRGSDASEVAGVRGQEAR